jgi:hypothetical protein
MMKGITVAQTGIIIAIQCGIDTYCSCHAPTSM